MGRHLLAGLGILLLSACGSGGEVCDNQIDDDGDGFVDCGDQDCFATCGEQCANNIDDDGDGAVDCLDEDCAAICDGRFGAETCDNGLDDDGDTFIDCDDRDCDPACDADLDGWRSEARGGNDCDDTNSAVNPGATEIPYNGVDDDCDPSTDDADVDNDGFDHPSMGGDDCDDTNPFTYPGAPETCGDGAINDCDTPTLVPDREDCFVDRSITTADATLVGLATDDRAGTCLWTAGDVNGDGYDDVAIGAYGEVQKGGAAYLVHGPLAGRTPLSGAATKWKAENEDDWVGYRIAGGSDVTGDGRPNVAFSALYEDRNGSQAGAVYLINATSTGILELVDPATYHAKILGAAETDWAGISLSMPGDVTGDEEPDLLIGSRNFGGTVGGVHVVPGPIEAGELHLDHVDTVIVGRNAGDRTGDAVAGNGDLDGNGVNDIVVGAPLVDRDGRTDRGVVLFYTHVLTGSADPGDADATMFGERANDHLGASLDYAGDVNNDGYDDVIIGAPDYDLAGDVAPVENAGKAYLVYGPVGGFIEADVHLYGEANGDAAGTSVAGIGDLNGDGYDDIAVGAPRSDRAGEDAGAVYILFGPLSGHIELADADIVITGAAPFDFAGEWVAPAGDVNRDTFPDLLIGAPFHDGDAPSSGAAYVFTFGY